MKQKTLFINVMYEISVDVNENENFDDVMKETEKMLYSHKTFSNSSEKGILELLQSLKETETIQGWSAYNQRITLNNRKVK